MTTRKNSDQQPAFVPVHGPVSGARTPPASTTLLTILAAFAGPVAFFYIWVSGAVSYDMCAAHVPNGCDPGITMATVGVSAAIVAAGLLGLLGTRRASRHGERTWPWPAAALLLIVVSTAAGAMILNTLSGA
ncbi:MAG: hypothetical protein K0U84_24755 [Actinomycetia bacterium]|nr:hypothetical protein [Actinomycetes bacterium]